MFCTSLQLERGRKTLKKVDQKSQVNNLNFHEKQNFSKAICKAKCFI